MLGELRNEYNEIKRNFDIEITRLEESNNNLNTQKQQVDNFEENKNQRIYRIENHLNTKTNELTGYNDEKEKILSINIKPYIKKSTELKSK